MAAVVMRRRVQQQPQTLPTSAPVYPRLLGRPSASPSNLLLKPTQSHGALPGVVRRTSAQVPGAASWPLSNFGYGEVASRSPTIANDMPNVSYCTEKVSVPESCEHGLSRSPTMPTDLLTEAQITEKTSGTPEPASQLLVCNHHVVQDTSGNAEPGTPPPALVKLPGAPSRDRSQRTNSESAKHGSSLPIKFGPDLEFKVDQCYKAVAGNGTLDVRGVRQIRNMLMEMLGLPKIAFGEMETQLLRFDLDGDHRLDLYEVFQCVKMNLFEYVKKQSGRANVAMEICRSSPSKAGYRLGKEIGHGNQGRAHVARRSADRELCCIKSYSKKQVYAEAVVSLQDEYNVLHSLNRHPNIAYAFDLFQDEDFYYMVQELYVGGDFCSVAERCLDANVERDEQWWRLLFKQSFLGLAHLHSNGMIHCDIKEPNLMLKTDNLCKPQVVIIDFGLVRTSASNSSTFCGTPGYIAPESWESAKMYPGGDIFALGVVMMQMLLDRVPPHHNPPPGVIMPLGIFTDGARSLQDVHYATRVNTPPFSELSSQFPVVVPLMRSLLDKNVLRRPCAKQALKDVWFNEVITQDDQEACQIM